MVAKTQIRVDVEPLLVQQAEEVLDALGLDVSSAVSVFLKKVVATHSIPFAVAEEPPVYRFSAKEEEEILVARDEAQDPDQVSGPFRSADQLIGHLRRISE
jgi:DNA-damage-inducible protein J